jgi:hypothetical protein
MRSTALSLAALLAAPALSAQDILYYKFNEGSGTTAINYGSAGAAPGSGTIVSTLPANYAAGFSGGALAGSASTSLNSYVDSGWTGGFSGDFTVAWFMKETGTPGTSLSYQFSNIGSFRCFTNGVAGTGLWVRAWGTGVTPADLQLNVDVQTLARGQWLHVALVVDSTAATATWYVNGTAQTPIAITGTPGVSSANAFRVGGHTSLVNFYDMDEFRFQNRAASATEILAWSLAPSAADAAFGAGCSGRLTSGGGAPTLGNAAYTQDGSGPANAPGALTIGFSSTSYGGLPLPLDLGSIFPGLGGCMLYGSADVAVPMGTTPNGTFSVPLGIPANQALIGVTLYNQGIVLAGPAGLSTTNALAVSVGI